MLYKGNIAPLIQSTCITKYNFVENWGYFSFQLRWGDMCTWSEIWWNILENLIEKSNRIYSSFLCKFQNYCEWQIIILTFVQLKNTRQNWRSTKQGMEYRHISNSSLYWFRYKNKFFLYYKQFSQFSRRLFHWIHAEYTDKADILRVLPNFWPFFFFCMMHIVCVY